jgi:hypothetical protein
MSFETHSGPIRVGTTKDGGVTSRNTGVVTLAQTSAAVPFGSMTTSPTAVNLFTLPAGSKILNFIVDVTTAISGGGSTNVGIQLGKAGSAAEYAASFNSGLSAARVAQSVVDAGMASKVVALDNIGTADITVQGTFTAAGGNPTAGATKITVVYMQRDSAGNANPTSV